MSVMRRSSPTFLPWRRTDTSSGEVIPPPAGASGIEYRTVIAFASAGSVNSTFWPAVRRTAERPDASASIVYASRPGPMTVPVVTAFSASCSRNGTAAPRPSTSAGSTAARVTTAGAGGRGLPWARADDAVPATSVRATAAAAATRARRRAAGWFVLRIIVDPSSLGRRSASVLTGGRADPPARCAVAPPRRVVRAEH